ncbi:hypothetical protein DI383_14275 [Flavobacteriaceae bacterium LYZ1037]|nr:hypothetical protein DI383_14275 [Flavobacteriaceae bacterium LYZ1037]
MKNKLILEKVKKYVLAFEPPKSMSKLGFFGSYAKQNIGESNDIDILVFEKKVFKNEDLIISKILQSISKEKDLDSTILNTFSDDVLSYLTAISKHLKIPLRMSLGPVINEPEEQYLHINASFNESLWRKFIEHLPIHAHLISTNYISIFGDKIASNKISKLDYQDYINLMDIRFKNYKITKSYLRKTLKSLALFHNYNSVDYYNCLTYLHKIKVISDEFLLEIKEAHNENELLKVYNKLKLYFYV